MHTELSIRLKPQIDELNKVTSRIKKRLEIDCFIYIIEYNIRMGRVLTMISVFFHVLFPRGDAFNLISKIFLF